MDIESVIINVIGVVLLDFAIEPPSSRLGPEHTLTNHIPRLTGGTWCTASRSGWMNIQATAPRGPKEGMPRGNRL